MLALQLATLLPLNCVCCTVRSRRLASDQHDQRGRRDGRYHHSLWSKTGRLYHLLSGRLHERGNQRRWPSAISGNPEKLTEEQARLFSTMTAHAGKYRISVGRLIHRVDVAHDPKMVGADLQRSLRFLSENQLESTLPPITTPAGKKMRIVLLWQRVK